MRKKYVMMGGYAFSEKSDMRKLKRLASEGWIFDGVVMPIFSYRFKKGMPQDLDFSVDYQKHVDEDYFSLFESAGWKHEATMGNEIHLFSAPAGTKPIYTDPLSDRDRLQTMGDQFRNPAMLSLVIFLALIALRFAFAPTGLWKLILLGGMILSIVTTVFTGIPYMGYLMRIRRSKNLSRLL